MPKAVDGTKRKNRRKKLQAIAKGFRGTRKNSYMTTKEAVRKSLEYAYRDRRTKKREFRSLWISRISAALTDMGISYSRFISGITKLNISLNRKALSNMAIEDRAAFNVVVEKVKTSLGVN